MVDVGSEGGGKALGFPTVVSGLGRPCALESPWWDFLSFLFLLSDIQYNPVSYSVLKWVNQNLLCISAGFWIWKISCPHLFSDLVYGEYIRLSCQPSHPKTKKILLESWQGLGMWWFVAPPPGTDDFCLMSLRALSRVWNLLFLPQQQPAITLYQRKAWGICRFYACLPVAVDHHLVLVQGTERGWYGCSTLELLQVPHEPAPLVGLFQVSYPPPIFLVYKELFRESKLSLCQGHPGILNYHVTP